MRKKQPLVDSSVIDEMEAAKRATVEHILRLLPPSERFFNTPEAARLLHMSERTLERMRRDGDGPAYVRTGKRSIAYREADILAFAKSRRFESTAAESKAAA